MATAAKTFQVGKRKFAPLRRELSKNGHVPHIVKHADPKAVESVEKMIKARGIKIVDFRFVDLLGLWQHFSIPVEELLNYKTLEDSMWVDGIGFDGSSIRGFQAIDESDMMLIPDPTSAFVDPILQIPTINIICDVYDPIHGEPYSRSPLCCT